MVLPRLFNQCLLETFWNHGPPEAFGTNALSEACWMHALTELVGVIGRLEVSLQTWKSRVGWKRFRGVWIQLSTRGCFCFGWMRTT